MRKYLAIMAVVIAIVSSLAMLASPADGARCPVKKVQGQCPVTTTSTTTSTAPTTTLAPTTTSTSTTTTIPPTTTAPTTTSQFVESFATDQRSRFDFQLYTAAAVPIADVFLGEHNTACQGADTFRDVRGGIGAVDPLDVSNSELSWWCSGHFMTALDTGGIAFLSFTPKQTLSNISQVCWTQNMNNLGGGKWVNVFVVPVDDITANGGNFSYASASEIPFGGNNRTLPNGAVDFTFLRGSTFVNKWGANGTFTETMNVWKSYFAGEYGNVGGMVPAGPLEASPRFKICLNSGGNMVIQRPTADGSVVFESYPIGATFPTGNVKVIFQDASYNPTKHDGFPEHLTWHWDDIVVSQ